MRRLPVLLLLLLGLAGAATPASAATPRSFFGVIADGPALAPDGGLGAEAAAIARSGTRTIRVAAYWDELEPEDGRLQLAAFDALVLSAARQGIGVLPVVHRTPGWAAKEPGVVGSPPRDPSTYARFLTGLVARYGPAGSLWRENQGVRRTAIRRWQVWNEPDITKFWSETDWAPGYARLLKAAATALRRVDGDVVVVAAGLTNRSWVDLRKLYATGARGSFDVAAIHPFSRRVSNVVKLARLARAEMRKAGDARKPLLLSEVSWSSGKGVSTFNYGWETTEAGQAERVRQALPALAKARVQLGLAGIYWYTWMSRRIGGRDSFDYGGLRRIGGGGSPIDKPALRAWRETVARLTR
ncbi:MAG: endo,4-beta-xylanase [Solirubrobacterales bacterium]|nr:endo,4-beta-xylanase [Solirubrobacterales bacterium]